MQFIHPYYQSQIQKLLNTKIHLSLKISKRDCKPLVSSLRVKLLPGPASIDFICLPFSKSQRRIWASRELDAAMGRVWLMSTDTTPSWWPSRLHCRSSFSSRLQWGTEKWISSHTTHGTWHLKFWAPVTMHYQRSVKCRIKRGNEEPQNTKCGQLLTIAFFSFNCKALMVNNRKTSEKKSLPFYTTISPLLSCVDNSQYFSDFNLGAQKKNPNFQGCIVEERALTISRPSPGHPGIPWPLSQSFLSCLTPRQLTRWHHHGLEQKVIHIKSSCNF